MTLALAVSFTGGPCDGRSTTVTKRPGVLVRVRDHSEGAYVLGADGLTYVWHVPAEGPAAVALAEPEPPARPRTRTRRR